MRRRNEKKALLTLLIIALLLIPSISFAGNDINNRSSGNMNDNNKVVWKWTPPPGALYLEAYIDETLHFFVTVNHKTHICYVKVFDPETLEIIDEFKGIEDPETGKLMERTPLDIHYIAWNEMDVQEPNIGRDRTLDDVEVDVVKQPDFTISATPSSRSVDPGDSTTYSVSVRSINGFHNRVNLSLSGLPSHTTYSFSPHFGTPNFTSTLRIRTSRFTPPGTYTLTITGTGGGKTHSAHVTLVVNQPPPNSYKLTVRVNPSGHGVVTVSYDGNSYNVTTTKNFDIEENARVTLSATSSGGYEFDHWSGDISGTNTTVSFVMNEDKDVTANFSPVVEPDFTISATPSSRSVDPGDSTTYSVSVRSLNGFSDTVNLSVSGLPSNTTGSFNNSSGTPTFSTTLHINTSSSTPPGTYTLTITGTGGGKTHSTSVTLTISQTSPNTYVITATAGPGGNIEPSGSVVVNEGEDKTFVITANPGFEIKEVKVDGEDVGPVSEYTFYNVNSDHTIEASFESEPTGSLNLGAEPVLDEQAMKNHLVHGLALCTVILSNGQEVSCLDPNWDSSQGVYWDNGTPIPGQEHTHIFIYEDEEQTRTIQVLKGIKFLIEGNGFVGGTLYFSTTGDLNISRTFQIDTEDWSFLINQSVSNKNYRFTATARVVVNGKKVAEVSKKFVFGVTAFPEAISPEGAISIGGASIGDPHNEPPDNSITFDWKGGFAPYTLKVIYPNGTVFERTVNGTEYTWPDGMVRNLYTTYHSGEHFTWYVIDDNGTQSNSLEFWFGSSGGDNSGAPTVHLIQPNGGETIRGGTRYTIKWKSSNLTEGKIRILFFNGSSWSTIVKNLPLTQTSYTWNVPNESYTGCKIRVGNYNPSNGHWIVYDDSDGTFSISNSSNPGFDLNP